MAEKIVNLAWRTVIMSLVGVGSLIALGMLYRGILALLSLDWQNGAPAVLGGILIGLSVWWLCRHRNDLICAQPAR